MEATKAFWELGDYSQVSSMLRESSEAIVQSLQITPGLKVLDLACGDGNTAIPIAKLGAEVTGVDIVPFLVAAATKRAADADVSSACKFQEGDASSLAGVQDDQFDLVISMFGAMFASKPLDVAKEMVRVAKKPGGRIVMGNWFSRPGAFLDETLKITSKYQAPPQGVISPLKWGEKTDVVERFGAAGVPREKITFEEDSIIFKYAGTMPEYVTFLLFNAPPCVPPYKAAQASGRADELRKELEELYGRMNSSKDPSAVRIVADFLRVKVEL